MKTTTSPPKAPISVTSKIKTNVSALERILMITSGGYLLYKGLSQNDKKFRQDRFWHSNASKRGFWILSRL
jgi:hypothetical protein